MKLPEHEKKKWSDSSVVSVIIISDLECYLTQAHGKNSIGCFSTLFATLYTAPCIINLFISIISALYQGYHQAMQNSRTGGTCTLRTAALIHDHGFLLCFFDPCFISEVLTLIPMCWGKKGDSSEP